ncbi:MAG: hypothetical protein ACTSXC_07895 [Candidatus Freyarchaeota archaeon]
MSWWVWFIPVFGGLVAYIVVDLFCPIDEIRIVIKEKNSERAKQG